MRQGGLILPAGRVRWKKKKTRKKIKKKTAAPKTHHEIHSIPATAINSRRRAKKHVPRVSPYSPASIDPGVCGNRLRTALAISKNVECYTHTDTRKQTDKTIEIMAPCTHHGMKRLYCLKEKNGLIIILRRSTSRLPNTRPTELLVPGATTAIPTEYTADSFRLPICRADLRVSPAACLRATDTFGGPKLATVFGFHNKRTLCVIPYILCAWYVPNF